MWAGQGAGWPGHPRTHACSPGSSSVVHVPGVNDIQSSSSSGQNLSQISRQLSQSQVAWTGSRPPFPGQVRPGRAPPTAAPGGAPHGAPEIPALGGAEHSRAPGPHATAVRVRGGEARSPAARGARPRQARGDLDLPPQIGATACCSAARPRGPDPALCLAGQQGPRGGPVSPEQALSGLPHLWAAGTSPGPGRGTAGTRPSLRVALTVARAPSGQQDPVVPLRDRDEPQLPGRPRLLQPPLQPGHLLAQRQRLLRPGQQDPRLR